MLERNKKYIAIIILTITIILCFYWVFIPMPMTDEAWAHSSANAKISYGYYTMPIFYDIEIFKEKPYYLIRNIDHLYRLSILIVGHGPNSIKLVRFILFILFIFSLFYYFRNQPYIKDKYDKIIIASLMGLFISILTFLIAREEILITSFVLIMMGIFSNYVDKKGEIIKKTELIIISFLCLLIHPNGIFIFIATGFMIFNLKNIKRLSVYYLFMFGLTGAYFVFFIDYNFPAYQEQFKLLTSGEIQKFILSKEDVIKFCNYSAELLTNKITTKSITF